AGAVGEQNAVRDFSGCQEHDLVDLIGREGEHAPARAEVKRWRDVDGDVAAVEGVDNRGMVGWPSRGRRGCDSIGYAPRPSTDLRKLQLDRLAVVAGEVERFDAELADQDVAIARAERLRHAQGFARDDAFNLLGGDIKSPEEGVHA